jgi:hypothetical protein
MLVAGIFGYSNSYSQDSTKSEHKLRKVSKKAHKGKYHKAIKKADKMEMKEKQGK